MSVVDGLPFADEKKKYILEVLDPVLEEMVSDVLTEVPPVPLDYMIGWLRKRSGLIAVHDQQSFQSRNKALKQELKQIKCSIEEAGNAIKTEKPDEDEEEEDEDDEMDEIPESMKKPEAQMGRARQSVSAEAYGTWNQKQAFTPPVHAKSDDQKDRLKSTLQKSFMFSSLEAKDMETILMAMKEVPMKAGEKVIIEGDDGDFLFVIETGSLECIKKIDGEDKVVKTCEPGDVFGELALLYNCPRAASVISAGKCVLWELDRETFKAICYEAANGEQPEYEGFSRPAGEAPKQEAPQAPEEKESADEDDDSDDEMKEELAPRIPTGKPRRQGVSAEAMNDTDTSWEPPVYPKSAEVRQQLADIIRTSHDSKMHMLFGGVSKDTFERILDACELKAVAKGESVIEQGDVGDYFYIVKSGEFDIFVSKGQDPPKKVFQAGAGFAFGELALLYNAPRSATISGAEAAEVFALDRTAFRNLVIKSSEAQFKQRVEFLNGVDVFQVLNENERASLAEVLEEEEFEDDEAIVEQGERDDKMFILLTGKAVACIKGDQGEVEVKTYTVGDYFGEIALLSGEPRKATVYAVGPCTCLYIARPTFMRVLGSLSSFLERNIGKYEKYQDAIASAASEDGQALKELAEDDDHKDDEHEGVAQKQKKVGVRKRERPSENLQNIKANAKIEKDDAEPETLADKVAQDFKVPALVTPAPEFEVPGTQMMVYGGLVLGQKFTMNKIVHTRTDAKPMQVGDGDEKFDWSNGATKIKAGTDIGIVCQKGQKSASDPTPNQDNFFVIQKDGVSMYGVADGHGPFGHLVSFRLVQTLPHFISKSEHYGKDWEKALKDAFLDAQQDLCKFCKLHNINIEASGAAGSVMVMEEQTVHIAFIGDARIMLGSWNRRDTRMIFCTKDHKPELPEEKARLEASGSEVREIDPGSYRIYLPGSNFPGLTMSRAFGDTACNGVLREPEYHKFLMQPTDQWYAIVASDGVWEFLEGEEVCNLTAKKLRLKGPQETINFLVGASRKRWEHCCGDYCDDITAILIQWNSDNKESKTNHSLTVKRPEK
mmetsp:Transcript_36608/g.105255  ORF Transcript_36608/g.105255 Transcript_36608/m.105255 type:complete len:1056 (-) Transcript_36608:152-3319(-)